MKDEVLNEIKDEISRSARKIAGNSGYGYLDCHVNQWKDCKDCIHEMEDMRINYLRNCLGQLNNSSRYISLTYDNVKENTNWSRHRFTQEDKHKIVMIAKEKLHELFNQKKKEIENEISSRW